jgi:pimeloyl-ACP methyl ester carboxylesterase
VASFVLVHGAWHGGWCWERLREQLSPYATSIYTPTLTGLGDRASLLSPAVSLQTHIDDIVQVLEREALRDVVLVGHSYAGMVVTGVAARVPERLARLVYLDAVVPQSGQCLFDCTGPGFRNWVDEQVKARGEGWRIPVAPPEFLGLSDSADIDWVMPRLVPHPYRSFREPVQFRAGQAPAVRRTYINCIGSKPPGGARSAQAAGIDDYHELPTGHDAMVTAPRELAELLNRTPDSMS